MLYNVGRNILAHAASIKPGTLTILDLITGAPPLSALNTAVCSMTSHFFLTSCPSAFNTGFGFLLGLINITGEQGALA